jgi:hypothetical protein
VQPSSLAASIIKESSIQRLIDPFCTIDAVVIIIHYAYTFEQGSIARGKENDHQINLKSSEFVAELSVSESSQEVERATTKKGNTKPAGNLKGGRRAQRGGGMQLESRRRRHMRLRWRRICMLLI